MLQKYDLLTLLWPSIFSFVNIYTCISFIMVFVSPFYDKKDIFRFTWTVHRKNHLPESNSSVLAETSTIQVVSLCVVFNQHDFGTLTIAVKPSLTLCSHNFYARLPSHTFAQKTPINLWYWSFRCVYGFILRHFILCSLTQLSTQVTRSAATARIDFMCTYSWTYFYSLLSTTFVLSREVTLEPLFSDRPNEHLILGLPFTFQTFPVTDHVINGVEPRPSHICVWTKFI